MKLDAEEAVPLGGADQPREARGPGARGAFVLKREDHPLILRLLAVSSLLAWFVNDRAVGNSLLLR